MSQIYTERPRQIEWFALAFILIVAALLRLGSPGVVEFKRDEANLSLLALQVAHGEVFPLLGISSSVGIPNAPVSVYILALPYLFSSDPTIATQFIGLLNVLAVLAAYILTRRYYGPFAAIVAGLLFAVSPWAVIYSRKIWAQDMLPLFIVLTIGTGLVGFIEGKRWAQLIHLPLLAITGQIHYGTFVLIPVTLYLLFTGRRRLTRMFLLSLMLMAVITTPYVVGALRALSTSGVVSKALSTGENKLSLSITTEALQYAAFTIDGTNIHSLAGAEAFQQYLNSVPTAYPLFNLLTIGLIASVGWLIWRVFRHRDWRTPVDIALLIWLLFTPLAFSITWTPLYSHYMIPMIPAAYIVIGAAVSDLWRDLSVKAQARRVVFVVGGLLLISIVVLQIWLQVALLNFLNTHITPGAFGTPLGYLIPVRQAILQQKPQSILVNLDGQGVGFDEEATVWNVMLYDIPSRRFLDANTEVYPATDTLYLSHRCTDETQNFTLRTQDEGCFAVGLRKTTDYDKLGLTPIKDGDKQHFANGASLIAYNWEAPCLNIAWTTEGPRPENFSFAVHFMNAKGEKLMDADGLSWHGEFWRKGDTVVRNFCAPDVQRATEIASVQLGMYTYKDLPEGRTFYNSDLLDENGTPVGQIVEIKFE